MVARGDETAEVQFVLEIVNVGDADQAVRKRGRLTAPLCVLRLINDVEPVIG